MKIFSALLALTAMYAVFVLPNVTVTAEGAGKGGDGPSYVPGEMLVQFKSGTTEFGQSMALSRANAVAAEKVRAASDNQGGGDLVLARFRADIPFQAARESLADDPSIEFIEPNWIYHHEAT